MLLSIQDLEVGFRMGRGTERTVVPAVKRVSFDIPENRTVALVGESGSGKSVTAMSILNLLPDSACRPRCPNCRRCAGARSPACSRTR